jgi:hypothetical protein
MKDLMKRILGAIFAILFFISCEKNEVMPENPMTGKLISFSPNMSETNTRAGDYYSWDDYYKICPDVTVYMTIKGQTSAATYTYNYTNKLLEYKDGKFLYYPIDNEPYQIIILWPVKNIQELYDENDYHNQDNFESFLRSDLLSDTINTVEVISSVSVLPIYFKHLRSKISVILSDDEGKSYKFPQETKINDNPSYMNQDSISAQIIYDRVKEGVSIKSSVIQFDIQGINCSFYFDVSTLQAGINRTVQLTHPFFWGQIN